MVLSQETALTFVHVVARGRKILGSDTEVEAITLKAEDIENVQMAIHMEMMLLAHGWLVTWNDAGEPVLTKRVMPDQSVGSLNNSLMIVAPMLNQHGVITVQDLVDKFSSNGLAEIVGKEKAEGLQLALRQHYYLMA